MTHKLIKSDLYLLVVDNSETKKGDYAYNIDGHYIMPCQGVLSLHDMLTKKKIIAHLPLYNAPIIEGVPLLPPIEDDVKRLAEQSWEGCQGCTDTDKYMYKNGYVHGYNNAKSVYALINIKELSQLMHDAYSLIKGFSMDEVWSEWDESVKQRVYGMLVKIQSLHQYPTEFECEMEYDCCKRYVNCIGCDATEDMINLRPKTITTAQGVQWVGKYK